MHRSTKPRDKAKVESAVQIAEQWILGSLRDQSFFSLADLNTAIRVVLERLYTRKFQKLDVSRKDLFEQIEVVYNYYSVPFGLIHKHVEVRRTAATVEIWYQGKRIAPHPRLYGKGRHQTIEAHHPASHQRYLEWTPERILTWGAKTGPWTAALRGKVMAGKRRPAQGFRSCLGILRLGQKYGPERLEKACQRAVAIHGHSYTSVQSILKRGLDTQPQARFVHSSRCCPCSIAISEVRTITSNTGGRNQEMIFQETLQKMHTLRLHGMIAALE